MYLNNVPYFKDMYLANLFYRIETELPALTLGVIERLCMHELLFAYTVDQYLMCLQQVNPLFLVGCFKLVLMCLVWVKDMIQPFILSRMLDQPLVHAP